MATSEDYHRWCYGQGLFKPGMTTKSDISAAMWWIAVRALVTGKRLERASVLGKLQARYERGEYAVGADGTMEELLEEFSSGRGAF